ncbi:hypothetical protein V6N11_069631 [Hibiscus sabdariffa]|uniref:Uncharacterized protein n=1 Tax=Hibiscus sabdariffa TaxID=183260 RepID=A0ABR2Q3B9_9ROSI
MSKGDGQVVSKSLLKLLVYQRRPKPSTGQVVSKSLSTRLVGVCLLQSGDRPNIIQSQVSGGQPGLQGSLGPVQESSTGAGCGVTFSSTAETQSQELFSFSRENLSSSQEKLSVASSVVHKSWVPVVFPSSSQEKLTSLLFSRKAFH